MTNRVLFAPKRECIACEASATPGAKRVPGEPNILAISMTIYRRGSGKGQLKAARKVNICEECFIQSLAAPSMFGVNGKAKKLLGGMRDSLSECYSGLIDGEQNAA